MTWKFSKPKCFVFICLENVFPHYVMNDERSVFFYFLKKKGKHTYPKRILEISKNRMTLKWKLLLVSRMSKSKWSWIHSDTNTLSYSNGYHEKLPFFVVRTANVINEYKFSNEKGEEKNYLKCWIPVQATS